MKIEIQFSKQFKKQRKSLKAGHQRRVNEALNIFLKNPFDIRLKNHALNGKMKDHRAISAGGDLRLIFREYNGYTLVLFWR